MDLPALLLVLMLLAAVYNVVTSLLIYGALDERGQHPSFLLLRLYIPRYADRYRRLTLAESGHTGQLFYHWLVSINMAFAAAIAALVALYLQA